MSLTVDVFLIRADGETQVLDVPHGCSDLAGFETWRRTVWGGSAVRALGAKFFPVLDGSDLRVEPTEVPEFLLECAMVRRNITTVAPSPDPSRPGDSHDRTIDTVSIRLANIQIAAGRALGAGGGVLIW